MKSAVNQTGQRYAKNFHKVEIKIMSSFKGNERVDRKILRNRLNSVPDLIQDTSWEKDNTKQDTIKDITSDSQVSSHFPYRWPPASFSLNIHVFRFNEA